MRTRGGSGCECVVCLLAITQAHTARAAHPARSHAGRIREGGRQRGRQGARGGAGAHRRQQQVGAAERHDPRQQDQREHAGVPHPQQVRSGRPNMHSSSRLHNVPAPSNPLPPTSTTLSDLNTNSEPPLERLVQFLPYAIHCICLPLYSPCTSHTASPPLGILAGTWACPTATPTTWRPSLGTSSCPSAAGEGSVCGAHTLIHTLA